MKKFLLFLSIFVFPLLLLSQNVDLPEDTLRNDSYFEAVNDTIPNLNIFETEDPLNITLKYDITSFLRTKKKGEYQDAVLEIHYDNNQTITKNIRLKARGNFRRENCFFPPIHLNFKTDPVENSDLTGKIKLVTHCSASKKSEYFVLREYQAYKMYNILSEFSLRVRLLNIKYIDTGKKERHYERIGFLIEPVAFLAKRKEATIIDPIVVRENNVVEGDADNVALFQYMIGNTDWRIKGGHNTRYIKPLNMMTDKVVPVPYDFDFSGFVGTSYSFPQEWTSLKSVKQREYLGYCRNGEDAYLNTISLFVEKENDIIKSIYSCNEVSDTEKDYQSKYIEGFYKYLDDPQKFARTLKNQCRTNF